MNFSLFYPAITAFVLTVGLMPAMIWAARRWGLTDDPRGRDQWRRLQKAPVANGGGIVLYIGLAVAILSFFQMWEPLWAVLLGGLILVIFGTLDDIWDLPPWVQLLGQSLAAAVVIYAGIRINYISNPTGGTIDLTQWAWVPLVITFLWVVGMINTVKFLDGVDGLSAGVGAIAAMALGALSVVMLQENSQTAMLAFTLAGGLFGYLFWNWQPAKIYYGEAGAALVGFLLAVLAIFSGGKIATAFLVMGLPILDVARLIIVRLLRGQKPWQGGRDHLHHLLYDAGLGARGTVLVLYLVSALFGVAALFLQTRGKILLAGGVLILLLILTWVLEGKK